MENLSRRASENTARAFLFIAFIALSAANFFAFLSHPVGTEIWLPCVLIIHETWLIFFIGGVWLRQEWARFICIIFLCFVTTAAIIAIPSIMQQQDKPVFPKPLFALALLNLLTALMLVYASPVRRLTSYDTRSPGSRKSRRRRKRRDPDRAAPHSSGP